MFCVCSQTVNVVKEVATFLHTCTRDIVGSDHAQVDQILQTLIEMCVGNPKNQLVIFEAVIVEPLNRLMEIPIKILCNNCTKEEKKVSLIVLL